MVSRQTYYAESLDESQTADTFTDKVTLTFTPDANSDYLLFWSCLINSDSTSVGNAVARFFHGSTEYGKVTWRPRNTASWRPFVGFKKFSFGASPGSQSFKIDYRQASAAQLCKINNASLIAIKMIASDEYSESDGVSSTTGTAILDKLVHDHVGSGDFVVLGYCEVQNPSSTGTDIRPGFLGTDSGTPRVYNGRHILAGELFSRFAVYRDTSIVAGEDTKWQYRGPGSSIQSDISRARILALKVSDMEAASIANDRTSASDTTTTYQNRHTLNPSSPPNVKHLVIAGAAIDYVAESDRPFVRVAHDGVARMEANYVERVVSAQPEGMSHLGVYLIDGTPTLPITLDWRAAAGTGTIDTSLLLLWQLQTVAPKTRVGGVGVAKRWFIRQGGVAVEKPIKVRVGGVAQDP